VTEVARAVAVGLVGRRIGAAPVHWSTCRDYHCNCSSESQSPIA
jgi:hypothetical protein